MQRISIYCSQLIWSTGRAFQAITTILPTKCIFKISRQTFPIKSSPSNLFKIYRPPTVATEHPKYKINFTREDIILHSEIMESFKRDFYGEFYKTDEDDVALDSPTVSIKASGSLAASSTHSSPCSLLTVL